MITYKIHLIRTGTTADTQLKRFVGQTDLPVCQKGLDALEDLCREYTYPKVEIVYSSPLQRCLQTADILYPNTMTEVIEDLQDMNLGEFEGMTFDELKEDGDFLAWLDDSFTNTPPGGEETAAFQERVVAALDQIFQRMMADRIGSAAVITHGGVIMSMLAAVGLPRAPLHEWAVANGTGYTLMMNTQLWMRDTSAEVFAVVPDKPVQDDMEVYGLYDDDK